MGEPTVRFVSAAILALAVVLAHAAEPAASQQPEYRPEKQLKLDLKWPGEANREAYVIVEFDVLANGKTANVKLRGEGFDEPRFANAALQAVRRST